MIDPIKTDAEAALADVKAKIAGVDATVKADETKAVTWIHVHTLYISIVIAFAVGALAGYFLHK